MNPDLFNFKNGKGFLYKIPAWIKLLLILLFTILLFEQEIQGCILFSVTALILSFFHGFDFIDSLKDLRSVFFYVFFVYIAGIISNFFQKDSVNTNLYKIFIPSQEIITLIFQLLAAILITSLVFKTTTPLQLKAGITQIELTIRKILKTLPFFKNLIKAEPKTSYLISLVITFIPRVFQSWNKLDLAWKNKNKKNGLKKIIILIPALFSVCLSDAIKTAKAIQSRNLMSCEDE